MKGKTIAAWAACSMIGVAAANLALANGGPFVVRYPKGDPAAKGVLARLDPTLKPARETRLRVVKEDLTIAFGQEQFRPRGQMPPLATVTAAYTIENPTSQPVEVDFGFPILRGIYINPLSMMPRPAVNVTVDKQPAELTVISNSLIYGIIRAKARETIEASIAKDAELATRVAALRQAKGLSAGKAPAQQVQSQQSVPSAGKQADGALETFLIEQRRWNRRDAALLVEYAGLDFGTMKVHPRDRWYFPWAFRGGKESAELLTSNLGPLAAIGEQKATQFFARLAGCFDRGVASSYEAIFKAWGGDVRERSLDLETGKIRPREIDVRAALAKEPENARLFGRHGDPTIYARVDYLDKNANLSQKERESCRRVLKNLPVVFTFAPMNLLHYRVTFPAGEQKVVTVSYSQYAYRDTRAPGSYQLAYVLHPASLWDDFGPIRLKIQAPDGVPCRASTPLETIATTKSVATGANVTQTYGAVLDNPRQKTGELFIALDQAAWDRRMGVKPSTVAAEKLRSSEQ